MDGSLEPSRSMFQRFVLGLILLAITIIILPSTLENVNLKEPGSDLGNGPSTTTTTVGYTRFYDSIFAKPFASGLD